MQIRRCRLTSSYSQMGHFEISLPRWTPLTEIHTTRLPTYLPTYRVVLSNSWRNPPSLTETLSILGMAAYTDPASE